MNEFYIIFEGIIDQQATTRFVQTIDKLVTAGAQKIIIFFSSLGGNIYEGFLLSTIIQNSRIPIVMHATNHIDSIANVIFLSAHEKTAESHVKFYLHGASSPQAAFDEKALKEQLSAIKINNGRIANFIAANSKIPLKKIRNMMRFGTTLSAHDAKKFGMISDVQHKVIPAAAAREEIIYIN